ncbi:transcriptional regulator [Pedobacter lusitanus]|uniref:Transcriptional regulator n=1 Tax=Pedobacter lusitanus TaxID=1503925 RepID=A0A0D0GRV1_9SPHI|nr:response regulator transcription factor [Pedobacter lusitanus]KIO78970.1 transcriptional regulator [Pedobacter lusitanus]
MSRRIRLLLIEDEEILAAVVKETLEGSGFEVAHAANGVEGWTMYHSFQPDLCIVDVMMPKKDGLTLIGEIRAIDNNIPLILLTAKSEKPDVLKGFQAGADDYMKKPFSIEELIFRVHAILRRTMFNAKPAVTELIRIGSYTFDYNRLELRHEKELKKLSQKEADILKMLVDHANDITSRKDMLMDLWGDDSFFNTRNMDVYISRLRKYLRYDEEVQIVNVRSRGLKLLL